jgi:hypothetical protein
VLAQANSATVGDKGGKPILALARIAAADERVSPSPHLSEQIEASVGLGKLLGRLAAKPGDVQLDVGALAVARGVTAFGLAAAAGDNIAKKGPERARPWKAEAARLIEAVDAMKADGKNASINDVHRRCLNVLLPIETGKAGAASALFDWLDDQQTRDAASKPLFKGDASTTIKVPAAKG